MKLKVDSIETKHMPLNISGKKVRQPLLKIILGDFEATTSTVEPNGSGFIFPEIFQLQVDGSDYEAGTLTLDVEAYDFFDGEYVYIGKGSTVLKSVVTVMEHLSIFYVRLSAYEASYEGPQPCDIHMRGIITNKDPIEEQLIAKTAELESVKQTFDAYVTSSKDLELEMEHALQMAQEKITKLSNRNTATTEKYNEIVERFNALTDEVQHLGTEMMLQTQRFERQAQESQQIIFGLEGSNSVNLSRINDLSLQIQQVNITNDNYKKQLRDISLERNSMQVELESLYSGRHDIEQRHIQEVSQLREELVTERRLATLATTSMQNTHAQHLASITLEMQQQLHKQLSEVTAAGNATNFTNVNNSSSSDNRSTLSSSSINNTDYNLSSMKNKIMSASSSKVTTLVSSNDIHDNNSSNTNSNDNNDRLRILLEHQLRITEHTKARNAKLLHRIYNDNENSIQVCCRVRPPSETEISCGGRICIDATTTSDSKLYVYNATAITDDTAWQSFEFDAICGYDEGGISAYSAASDDELVTEIDSLVAGVIDRATTAAAADYYNYYDNINHHHAVDNNCSSTVSRSNNNAYIIAYGSEGTGKSFSMTGMTTTANNTTTIGDCPQHQHVGISYKCILKLFELLEAKKVAAAAHQAVAKAIAQTAAAVGKAPTINYEVTMSVLAVYPNEVRDLLQTADDKKSVGLATTTGTRTSLKVNGPVEAMQLLVRARAKALLALDAIASPSSNSDQNRYVSLINFVVQFGITVTKEGNSSSNSSNSEYASMVFPTTCSSSSQLTLIDLASKDPQYSDEHEANKNLIELCSLLSSSSDDIDSGALSSPYQSPLVNLITNSSNDIYLNNAKIMLIVHISPMDVALTAPGGTLESLAFAASLKEKRRRRQVTTTATTTATYSAVNCNNFMKAKKNINIQMLSSLKADLIIAKQQVRTAEEDRISTKRAAQTIVKQLSEHNNQITRLLHDNQQRCEQLDEELRSTRQYLKKAVEQLSVQVAANERLVAIASHYEENLNKQRNSIDEYS